MTFEEMQQIIQGMLGVQRDLQDSQLKLAERQSVFMGELEELRHGLDDLKHRVEEVTESQTQAIQGLIQIQAETNVKFERLVGYSIDRERDSLDIKQDVLNLMRRVSELERQQR